MKSYQGPIPDPETLAQYDALVPGSAERLINRFEKQSDHRMSLETTVVKGDINRSRIGLYFGGVFAAGILALAFYMVSKGQAGVAGTMVGAVTASIIGAFIYGRAQQAKERKEKTEIMQGDRKKS